MKRIVAILFFFLHSIAFCNGNGSNRVCTVADSIAKDIRQLTKLANRLIYKNTDSAIIIANQILEITTKEKIDSSAARSYNILGNAYYFKGDRKKALDYYKKSLPLFQKLEIQYGVASSLVNIGGIYGLYGDYALAVQYLKKALDIGEMIANDDLISSALNNLGIVYRRQGDFELALKTYNKTLTILNKGVDSLSMAGCMNNIGIVYSEMENFSLALEYFERVYQISYRLANKGLTLSSYNNLGATYFKIGDYNRALKAYSAAIEYNSNNFSVASKIVAMRGLAGAYLAIDSLSKSLYYAHSCIHLAIALNAKSELKGLYSTLQQAHTKLGNTDSALFYLEKEFSLYKELFDIEKTKIISNLETLMEIEETDKEIEILSKTNSLNAALADKRAIEILRVQREKESEILAKKALEERTLRIADSLKSITLLSALEAQNIQIKNEKQTLAFKAQLAEQNKTRNAIISIAVLLIFLVTIIALLYYIKVRANKKLASQNMEISNQQAIIVQKNAILQQFNSELEKANRNNRSGLNYAKRIQEAALPKEEILNMLLPRHFIMFEPKNVVSGDFYFAHIYHNNVFIAVADCTGHGVPGALLSMLGIAFLNELTGKPGILNAAHLLNLLREKVKISLQQTGAIDEQQEGMDIAMLMLDLETYKISFAGAHNSLVIFRDETMHILPASTMPIGVYMNEEPFTNSEFQLLAGDTLYMYTDGYYSQFHHSTGETFKRRHFVETLAKIHKLGLNEQYSILTSTFKEWKGNTPQIDDVLVMGIRI